EVRVGIFDEPIADVNYRDFDLRSPFGRRRGRLARHFGFNRFQFLGALSEKLVFGCAIADTRLIGTIFVYLYDPKSGIYEEKTFRRVLAAGIHFDTSPESGRTSFHTLASKASNFAEMQSHLAPPRRDLRVALANGISIDACFHEDEPAIEPMRIATRSGASGWVYARKTAGQKVSGHVRWRDRDYDLEALDVRGHNDWSAGYMSRRTFWNWSCLAGRDEEERVVGLNVACGVNETSFTENCFWLDGRLHKVDSVHFAYDRHDVMRPWRVTSYDGRVALDFTPLGRHRECLNAGIVGTNFNQLFGRYSGELKTKQGERVRIRQLLGYAESHYAKW
ncbi:MAG: hypothetical protein ACI91F_003463, partial [Candidatus Binatia bacterium]